VALTKLTKMDSCPIQGEDFTPEFKVWITNQVDIINFDLELLDTLLASIDARLIAGGL
jgi:hypothetical protein